MTKDVTKTEEMVLQNKATEKTALKSKQQDLEIASQTANALPSTGASTPDLPSINTNDGRYSRYGWIALIIVFLFGGTWSATAPLNSAAVAVGEVVVVSHNKVVQHLEGGIVAEILVSEGELVEKNQPLIRLNPTQAQAEHAMISGQLNEIIGLEARLRAEQMSAETIAFPPSLTERSAQPDIQQIIEAQTRLFEARRTSLASEMAIYNQRIRALNQQIQGLTDYILTLEDRIASYEAEIKDWDSLFQEQFADKTRITEMQRELTRLRGERDQNRSEIARLNVMIAETENQKILSQQQMLKEVSSELPRVQAERMDLNFRKQILEDRLNRITIPSPDTGLVKGLNIFTLGSVIRPGETLMEIVPRTEDFAVRVRVNTTDINQVHVGLIADVRFSAFNTQTTHVIEGEVINISADKFVDERQGMEYFEARIKITPAGVEQMRKDGIFILPGMPAEAMIKTGDRTVFGYFVKPFQDMFARAFRES